MANKFAIEAVFKGIDKMTAPVRKMSGAVATFARRAKARIATVGRTIKKLGSTTKTIAKGFAKWVGIPVGAFGFLIKKVADTGDELAKLGRRVGFSVEALQEYRHVAELAGVSNELFDNSLSAFTKRLGEAKAGTGSLATILKKMDKQLLGQLKTASSNEEAFKILIGALRGIEDPAKRSALAAAAFSRAGLKMANIADSSADAVRKQREEMRGFGVISQKSAEESEAFNDMLTRMFKAFQGVANVVASSVIPQLTPMIENMTKLVVDMRPEIEAWTQAFVQDLPNKLTTISASFLTIKDVLNSLLSIGRSVAAVFDNTFGIVGRFLGRAAGAIAVSIDRSAQTRGDLIDQADAQMVSPQERVARSIEERRTTTSSELLIRDQTGRAEPRGALPPGVSLELSGAFP